MNDRSPVTDTVTPGNEHYNQKSAWAKTIQTDGKSWGQVPADAAKLAHANSRMTCYACHTSWTPNCFGCHLSMMANQRKPMLHNEGLTTRNWTGYDFQVLRDDGFMLGIDGAVTGSGKICADSGVTAAFSPPSPPHPTSANTNAAAIPQVFIPRCSHRRSSPSLAEWCHGTRSGDRVG